MDQLQLLQTFVRVAERGSLSQAARELGVTQPAVSKQIAALEARVAARLLQRTTRKVALTDAGRRYYERCRAVLGELDEAAAELRPGRELRGPLRVHAPTTFGELFLGRLALQFQQSHPEVVIDLVLNDRYVNLVEEGADVAIRMGRGHEPGRVVKRLGLLARVLVASPAYLRRHGAPKTAADLARHRGVRFSGAPGGDVVELRGPRGPVSARIPSAFTSNNALVLRQALLAGAGIGQVPRWLVHEPLRHRALSVVLPELSVPPTELNAVYPSGRFVPERARRFVEHVAEGLRRAPGIQLER